MSDQKQTIDTYKSADIIFGLSYAEWTVQWFKWWASAEKSHPQKGEIDPLMKKVFFLTTKQMERFDKDVLHVNNNIPIHTAILFPVDKWLSVGFPFTPDDVLKITAKERIDNIPNISINLDGIELEPVRIQSDVFQLTLRRNINNPETPDNLKKIVKGKYKAVCEGYWIFLKPNSLSSGTHEMPSYATCKKGELSLDVRQHLEII
jgi:hypothetical protein